GPGDGTREKDGPVVREADHRVHEGFFGDRTEDDAEYERRHRKFQTLESVTQNAEANDQPEIGDVVADRKRPDEAEDQYISRYDRFGEIEDFHQRPDGEIADRAHQCEAEKKRGEHGVDEWR